MAKIEMLDDDGQAEICEVHECHGDENECESPAVCEDCGLVASLETPVYVWTSGISEMSYWACGSCLAKDDFAQLKI